MTLPDLRSPTPEEEATLPLIDLATMPTEEAVRHLVEEYRTPESHARFMVATAKGEIHGDVGAVDGPAPTDGGVAP